MIRSVLWGVLTLVSLICAAWLGYLRGRRARMTEVRKMSSTQVIISGPSIPIPLGFATEHIPCGSMAVMDAAGNVRRMP